MLSSDEKKRRLIAAAEQITAGIGRDLLTAKALEAQLAFACGNERQLIIDEFRLLSERIQRDGKRAKVFTAAALQIIAIEEAAPPSDAVN